MLSLVLVMCANVMPHSAKEPLANQALSVRSLGLFLSSLLDLTLEAEAATQQTKLSSAIWPICLTLGLLHLIALCQAIPHLCNA